MKKILIIFVSLFFVNLCLSSQIQRKFYDFTLGQTSKSEVVNYFKAKQIEIVDNKENSVAVRNVRFGGYEWPFSAFRFYNNKLVFVYFSNDEQSNSKESLSKTWEHLVTIIDKKYSNFFVSKTSSENILFYNDNITNVQLKYTVFEGIEAITLSYADNQLLSEECKEDENEL